MNKLIIWIKIILNNFYLLPNIKLKFVINYFIYFKILNDKNYKLLKSKYFFFYDIFCKKLFLNENLFDNNISNEKKIYLIKKNIDIHSEKFSLFHKIFIYNYFRLFDSLLVANFLFDQINLHLISIYQHNRHNKKLLPQILNATIYNKNIELFNEILEKYNYNFLYPYKNLKHIIENNKIRKNQDSIINLKKIVNKKYYDYVYNKNIIVIGPAFTENILNHKNNYNNSIFIYTSHRKYSKNYNDNKILYLNSYKINNLYSELEKRKADFNFINVKNKNDLNFLANKSFNNIRQILASNVFFNNGFPMMIHCLIYDLISFYPQNILLTGVDFYLFALSGNQNYKDYDLDLNIISNSIREHDIFENKKFIEFLFFCKIINLDTKTENLFKIDDINFSKILDFHYNDYSL